MSIHDEHHEGGRAEGRDEVTALFARALEGGDPTISDIATGTANRDPDAAFHDLIELAYAGESRAELGMRAIVDVDVEVARAEADGTMPTPARFDQFFDQAWAGYLERGDGAAGGRRSGVVIRDDGGIGFDDDTAGPDAP